MIDHSVVIEPTEIWKRFHQNMSRQSAISVCRQNWQAANWQKEFDRIFAPEINRPHETITEEF